jgi:uncharacterized protein YdhG (YjbR/CyaY superfamily)
MQSKAITIEQYISELPNDRKLAITKMRAVLSAALPEGFSEVMSYGFPGFVVPHSLYPNGYHCDPKQPLPFISYASQKNFIALYHMGIYSDPKLLKWFTDEFPKHSKFKLDMGKSCVRFKKPEHIPYELIGELATKMTKDQWVDIYEAHLKK